MWCNPWGIWWDEVRASDILRLDADGEIVDGEWDVTPAVFLHTELHRTRADATIIVHNHPYYATLLATMREMPRMVHQNSCIFDGELAFVDEYAGVDDAQQGKWLAAQVGDASGILLAQHGAIVTGSTIGEACYKAVTFERMCRFTYDILAAGRAPVEIPADSASRAQGRRCSRTRRSRTGTAPSACCSRRARRTRHEAIRRRLHEHVDR